MREEHKALIARLIRDGDLVETVRDVAYELGRAEERAISGAATKILDERRRRERERKRAARAAAKKFERRPRTPLPPSLPLPGPLLNPPSIPDSGTPYIPHVGEISDCFNQKGEEVERRRIDLLAGIEDVVREYPHRPGAVYRHSAERAYRRQIRAGATPEAILKAVRMYKAETVEPKFRLSLRRFLSTGRWKDYATAEPAEVMPGGVMGCYVERNTPEWTAWRQHRLDCGERVSFMDSQPAYWVPTRWPPGHKTEQR